MADHNQQPITASLAQWAANLEFSDLPAEVVYQAKRFILDSIACALGGYQQHDVQIALQVLNEISATGPATVIGAGTKMDVVHAAFANALMIRCMDYNDVYWKQDPCHPSDILPAAISCAEKKGSDGRELIVGLVLGHELEQRFCEIAFPGIRERGWHHATLTAFVSPIVAGRMLRLSSDEIQNAIGISASARCTLGSVTAGKLTMMKNTVDPMATESGVLAALLADHGYTGPEGVIDGKEGLVSVFGPEWRLETLTAGLSDSWRIMECGIKFFPSEALTHTPISAVLDIIGSHTILPEHIREIEIRTTARGADILSDASKYDPRSKETADHSLPFCIAAAIVDREVTPQQFTQERIMEPAIRRLLGKVKVKADPIIESVFPEQQRAVVTIHLHDSRSWSKSLDFPKGHARNPLTDQELEKKFRALVQPLLSASAQDRLLKAIWDLDAQPSAASLMGLCCAQ